MTTHYIVSRVAPATVESDLIRLWRSNLPVSGDVRAKLRWSYHDVPEPPERVYMLQVRDGDLPPRIVGSAGVVVRRFASPAGELRVALGCDLAVERAHRVVLPALRLVRQIRRDTCGEFDLIYNFPNEHARGLYARAGYHDLGTMIRYVKVLRTAPYIARVVKHAAVARAVGSVADLAIRARLALAIPRAARAFRLEWLDDIDARFDALWEAARAEYALVGWRDAGWLRWRWLANPDGRCRIAALVDDGCAVRAYAIVRLCDGVAHVCDLFGMPCDLDSLVALLSASLRDQGAASVSFRFLGGLWVRRLLAAHGFRARRSTRHVYVAAGDALTRMTHVRIADVEAWHLTDYDEDT